MFGLASSCRIERHNPAYIYEFQHTLHKKNDKLTSWDLIFAIMLKVAHSSLLWLQKIEYLSLITMIIAKSLLAQLKKSANTVLYDLDAWCILPDHIHLIITLPEDEHNYSNIIREIKKNVTKKYSFTFE